MNFTKVDLVLLLMIVIWGANLTVIKMALVHFDPMAFNCLRFIIASVTMLALYRNALRDRIERSDWWKLLGLGVLGNTLYQPLFINGVHMTHVSHVAILLGVTPILTAGISTLFGIEKVRRMLWVGILLSFSGVILIVLGGGDVQAGNFRGVWGDIFIFVASLSWSIYSTFSQGIIRKYSFRHYLVYTILFGTLFLIPVSIPSLSNQNWSILGWYEWAALVYAALLALVFGYSAWYYAVEKIGSTRTSVYSNLTPVAGLITGMIFLGERLSLLQWIGAMVIFCGLMLNRFTELRAVQPE